MREDVQDCGPQEGRLTHQVGKGGTREGLLEEGVHLLNPVG